MKNSKKNTKTSKILEKTYKMRLAKEIFETNLEKYFPEAWNYLHSKEATDARKLWAKGKQIDKPAVSYRQIRAEQTGTSGIQPYVIDNGNIVRIKVLLPFTPVTNKELFTKMMIKNVYLFGTQLKQTKSVKTALKKMIDENPFLKNYNEVNKEAHAEYAKTMQHISNRKADQFTNLYIYKKDNKVHTFFPANIPSELRFIKYCYDNDIEFMTRLVKNYLRAEMRPNKFEDNSWKYREYDDLKALYNVINKYCIKDEKIIERMKNVVKKNIEVHNKYAADKKEMILVKTPAKKKSKNA